MIIVDAVKIPNEDNYRVTVRTLKGKDGYEEKQIILTREEFEEAQEENNRLEDF